MIVLGRSYIGIASIPLFDHGIRLFVFTLHARIWYIHYDLWWWEGVFITALFGTWYSYYLFIFSSLVFLSISLMDFYCVTVAYDIAPCFYPFREQSNFLLRSLFYCSEERIEQFVAEIAIMKELSNLLLICYLSVGCYP